MKKLLFLLTLMVLLTGINENSAKAQIKLSFHVNFGQSHPCWIPENPEADYYYLPTMDMYYCISQGVYIYLCDGNWCFSRALPERYEDMDFSEVRAYPIYAPRPYLRDAYYRRRYAIYVNPGQVYVPKIIYRNAPPRYRYNGDMYPGGHYQDYDPEEQYGDCRPYHHPRHRHDEWRHSDY